MHSDQAHVDLNPQLTGCLCRWEEFCSISRPSYLGTSCTCGDSLGGPKSQFGLSVPWPAWGGDTLGGGPSFGGGGGASSLLATSPLMCPCSSGGRSRAPQGGGEGRAGPDREFEKRKEVGPAECLATPWLLPRGTTPGAHRPPAQPWLPGAKLTRSGKAWVGAGVGSAAGSRAGSWRTARWKMLSSPRLPGRAERLHLRSWGVLSGFLRLLGGQLGGEEESGGEEGGHPAHQAAPSLCQHPVPPA